MSTAKGTADWLAEDFGKDASGGFRRDFADAAPCKYLPQRADMDKDEIMKQYFDASQADAEWTAEYNKGGRADGRKMWRLRTGLCFLVSGGRDVEEDFGNADVECLRRMRTPMVTSRTPLKVAGKWFL